MKKGLLVLLVLLSPLVGAADVNQQFVMSEEHCNVFKRHALQAIAARMAGVTYPQFVRDRVEEYRKLPLGEQVVYLDILPYSLEMANEYFHSDFNSSTPYEEIVYRRCQEGIGRIGR